MGEGLGEASNLDAPAVDRQRAAIDVESLSSAVAEGVSRHLRQPAFLEAVALAVRVGMSEGMERSRLAERMARMPSRADLTEIAQAVLGRLDAMETESHRPAPPVIDAAPPGVTPADVERLATGVERTWVAAAKISEESRSTTNSLERLSDLVLDMETRVTAQVAQWLDVLREEVRHLTRLQTAELEAMRQQVRALDRRQVRTSDAATDEGQDVIELRDSVPG